MATAGGVAIEQGPPPPGRGSAPIRRVPVLGTLHLRLRIMATYPHLAHAWDHPPVAPPIPLHSPPSPLWGRAARVWCGIITREDCGEVAGGHPSGAIRPRG